MNDKRNYYLDYWKGIACFVVVYAHTYYPFYIGTHDLGDLIKGFMRFAIPLFFMVSGYYCYYTDREIAAKKIGGKIKHIFTIFLTAVLFWLTVSVAMGLLGDNYGGINGIIAALKMQFTLKNMVYWVFLNQDPFIKILWFISALLYVYILLIPINKYNLYKHGYIASIVFLIAHVILGNVTKLYGIKVDAVYYRNFLLFGFPFFMMGHFIRANQDGLTKKFTVKMCVVFIVLGELLVIPEWFFIGKTEMYIGNILTTFFVFVLTIILPARKKDSFITTIGRDMSLFIYITHMFVGMVMEKVVASFLPVGTEGYRNYEIVRCFICFGICVLGAMLFNSLKSLCLNKKQTI